VKKILLILLTAFIVFGCSFGLDPNLNYLNTEVLKQNFFYTVEMEYGDSSLGVSTVIPFWEYTDLISGNLYVSCQKNHRSLADDMNGTLVFSG